ncbi:hypothetical protein [Marispirochaeta aestuarii]|uniref:hypothetical protein n=1 Tax=Marispirochaeta aestuarii TaxID=1963862 RepID=UPI002ABE502B|nr:hypothetical protein [Marispirochaeta aestuarii]
MKFLFPDHQSRWLLWIMDADATEENDFKVILGVLRRFASFTVPIREITRQGIDFRSSSIIKKMLKEGFLRLSKSEFEIHQRYLNNRAEIEKELHETYTAFSKAAVPVSTLFPSSVFSILPEDAEHISPEELDSLKRRGEAKARGVLEILFDKNQLPPILLHGEFLEEFPLICWRKIRYHLALLAGENADVFSDKIGSYKNLILGRPRELLENGLSRVQHRTEKEFREEATRLVMDRIIASGDASRQVLSDLVSPDNSYILTRYSYDNPEDFDFLQSLTVLEKMQTAKEKRRNVTPEDYLHILRDTINLCISAADLVQTAENTFPEIPPEELKKNFQLFQKNHVGMGSEMPEALSFTPPGGTLMLIHRDNLEAYLDARGARLNSGIRDKLHIRWNELMERHRFEDAMLTDKAFRDLIQKTAAQLQPDTAALLRSTSLYEFLSKRKSRSEFIRRLQEYPWGQTDRIFHINREELYNEIYRSIYSRYSWLGSILYRFLHWIAKSVFMNQPENGEDKGKTSVLAEKEESSETDILKKVGLSDKREAADTLSALWEKLPADILPREEIDRNILTELNAFYNERSEVVFGALSVITERNLRRVLQQASHLEGYSQALREYMECKMITIIASRSDLRAKTRP